MLAGHVGVGNDELRKPRGDPGGIGDGSTNCGWIEHPEPVGVSWANARAAAGVTKSRVKPT